MSSSFVLVDQKPQQGARRRNAALMALFALLLAGCADSEVAGPGLEATPWSRFPVGRAPAGIPSPDIIMHSVADDSMSAEFTVTPTGGVFHLGPHAIYLPAHSICDPATSTYGPTEWDAPCNVLTAPIRFRAEIREFEGRSWVDFTPAVRFVPTNEPANAVWLYMKTSSLSTNPDSAYKMLGRLSVLYSPSLGAPGIDEAKTDASLATFVWLEGGIAFRRIKHFSGYNIYTGLVEEEGASPSVVGSLVINVSY